MTNIWDRVRGFLGIGDVGEAAAEEMERQAEEEAAATRRANRAFDKHGPTWRDQLPGSPRRHLFRRGRRK